MDHLPPINNPLTQAPEVPFLCQDGAVQPNCRFSDFPRSRGIHMQQFRFNVFNGMSFQEAASFFQEWLFFQLIREVIGVCGIPFHREDFVLERENGRTTVTTGPLPRYLWYWAATEVELSKDLKFRRFAHVEACLKEAALIMKKVKEEGPPQKPTFLKDIFSSITLAGELLSHTARAVYMVGYGADQGLGNSIVVTWPRDDRVLELLQHAGWCPNEISTTLFREHNTTLYYLSMLSRPQTLPLHHSQCSEEQCRMNVLDNDTYRTRHWDSCSREDSCESLGIDYASVPSIEIDLKTGRIPLITVTRNKYTDELEIHLQLSRVQSPPLRLAAYIAQKANSSSAGFRKPSRPGPIMKYVAISHVWSDGMGNRISNSLPKCQLSRLQSLVNKLYDKENPQPFWVDTVCVPRERSLRNLAMHKMRDVYLEADKVLVIDGSIQGINYSDCSPGEMVLRVKFSKWARRLWTLQEGLLARKLYFQFRDQAVQGESLLDRLTGELFASKSWIVVPQREYLERDLVGDYGPAARKLLDAITLRKSRRYIWSKPDDLSAKSPSLRDKIRYGFDFYLTSGISYIEGLLPETSLLNDGKMQSLGDVAYSFSQRTTSWKTDETLCIATLMNLGLDAYDTLLEVETDDPRPRMIRLLDMVANIPPEIIFCEGERIEMQGYRWAQVSFLQTQSPAFRYNSGDSNFSARKHPEGLGLLVEAPGIAFARMTTALPGSESVLLNIQMPTGNKETYEIFIRQGNWSRIDSTRRLMLVLRDPLESWYISGILASVCEELSPSSGYVEDTIYVRFEANVTVGPGDDAPSVVAMNMIEGAALPLRQKWCVD